MTHEALIAGLAGKYPRIDPGAFLAPTCVVVGEVTVAAGASVWYHTVLRADCGPILLGPDCNIQDNCTLHSDPGSPLSVGARVSVGHNAVLHGCVVEDDVLIGMGATVLNGAHIGTGSLIAAQALVPQGMRVPPGSMVAGVPAKVRRRLTEEEKEGIKLNAAVYTDLSKLHRKSHPSRPDTASPPGTASPSGNSSPSGD
ncbi:gamma carbonic anhydrase family protein [Streptomyces sp. NPDC006638]|uniref:gamma carbonic anhydrase family protein n=1 Tax=Streptomyces sp. NPDC006638 TaxID=3157183 RepID=UPI0033ABCBE3